MNGIKALETIGEIEFYELERRCESVRTHCEYEYNTIESELKVLQILKEKNVDLMVIRKYAQYHRPELTLDIFLDSYNLVRDELTIEEMTLIVEWLRSKQGGIDNDR